MGVLGTSFQIGRSALAAYQAAISVVGQNIANVANSDYTRQTGRFTALHGGVVPGGTSPGVGVRLSALQRHFDGAIEARLRDAVASRDGSETVFQSLSQVEALYNELSDQDISTDLSDLFSSFSALQGAPDDATTRNLVLSAADRLIQTFDRVRTGLLRHVSEANESVSAAAQRANALAGEIAGLNETIVTEEAAGQRTASALRDRRDALLRELSSLMQVTLREQENGSVNVYIEGEPLVEFGRSRGLTTERVFQDGYELAALRFVDNNGAVFLREGRLAGLIEARDLHLVGQVDRLDRLARGLIYEVNRVHSNGRGLVGYDDLTGAYRARDPGAALNTSGAGLEFPVQNGTLIVNVRDTETGQTITRQIEVDLDGIGGDTTLRGLAAAFDAVPGLNGCVTSDDRLRLTADAGSEFWMSEDTSGALAALGIGVFFVGTSASSIDIAPQLRVDNRLISAALTEAPGDGANAGALAELGQMRSSLLDNQAIQDFHAATVNGIAVAASAALTEFEASDAVFSSLTAQREAISGVSLDEEAINLSRFETAFQAAARYLNVLNRLTDEVLALAL